LQILFEETLYQNSSEGKPFVELLKGKGIIPGIKASCPAGLR
jgi:fructose-bisphosphate aldolase class I